MDFVVFVYRLMMIIVYGLQKLGILGLMKEMWI